MDPADLFQLQPTDTPGRWAWSPPALLLTPATTLQGGAGLGVTTAAMVAATGRPVLWATAQYLSYAAGTAPVHLDVTIEVAGHNTTQARCVLSRDGQEVLTAHGALGSRTMEHSGVWALRPDVPAPDDCPEYHFFRKGGGHIGDLIDVRLGRGRQLDELDGVPGDGSFALWIRVGRGVHPISVAEVAFIGDYMPLGFADALGHPYAGNSLDNTLRVGTPTSSEWVLLATHVDQVVNGFGHGRADLWAEDGTLLGQVSQTAVVRMHQHINQRGVPANAL